MQPRRLYTLGWEKSAHKIYDTFVELISLLFTIHSYYHLLVYPFEMLINQIATFFLLFSNSEGPSRKARDGYPASPTGPCWQF